MTDKIIFVRNAREAIKAKNFLCQNYHFSKVNDNFDEEVLECSSFVKYVSMRREFNYQILFGTKPSNDNHFDIIKLNSSLALE